MRVLLTGSSGWLGRFLAPQLRSGGHAVAGLDVAPGRDTQVLGSVADRDLVPAVIRHYFPDAEALYAERRWRLPRSIGRVYDASRAERVLGFCCATDFGSVLEAIRRGDDLPFAHDSDYLSPQEQQRREAHKSTPLRTWRA